MKCFGVCIAGILLHGCLVVCSEKFYLGPQNKVSQKMSIVALSYVCRGGLRYSERSFPLCKYNAIAKENDLFSSYYIPRNLDSYSTNQLFIYQIKKIKHSMFLLLKLHLCIKRANILKVHLFTICSFCQFYISDTFQLH